MRNYQVDWVGAVAAGVAAGVAFWLTRAMWPRLTGKSSYVIAGGLTIPLALVLRMLLRYVGI
jgi:hypothetical protein